MNAKKPRAVQRTDYDKPVAVLTEEFPSLFLRHFPEIIRNQKAVFCLSQLKAEEFSPDGLLTLGTGKERREYIFEFQASRDPHIFRRALAEASLRSYRDGKARGARSPTADKLCGVLIVFAKRSCVPGDSEQKSLFADPEQNLYHSICLEDLKNADTPWSVYFAALTEDDPKRLERLFREHRDELRSYFRSGAVSAKEQAVAERALQTIIGSKRAIDPQTFHAIGTYMSYVISYEDTKAAPVAGAWIQRAQEEGEQLGIRKALKSYVRECLEGSPALLRRIDELPEEELASFSKKLYRAKSPEDVE